MKIKELDDYLTKRLESADVNETKAIAQLKELIAKDEENSDKLAKENATLLNAFKDDVRNRVFKPNPNNNQDDNASEPMTWADAFQKMLNNRKEK